MTTTPTPPFDAPMANLDAETFNRDQALKSYLSYSFEDALAELNKAHGPKWVERFIAKRIRRGAEHSAVAEQSASSVLTGPAAEQSANLHQKWRQDGSEALHRALASARHNNFEPAPYLPEDGAI